GDHCGDNGDINGIGHPMRLMQNPATDARPRYHERLAPSLWLLVTIALAGPMVSLIFVPVGSAARPRRRRDRLRRRPDAHSRGTTAAIMGTSTESVTP
ncbi:hypothetical protein CTI14_54765, partial [Methylobacterium radiotolerans]